MKIPEQFINKNQLFNLKVGQSGYIVPWGMWVDLEGNAFLNENYNFHESSGGTVSLLITRVSEGYVAHLDSFKYFNEPYTWEKQDSPGFNSPKQACYGKIVAFSMDNYNQSQKDPDKIREMIDKCIQKEDYEEAGRLTQILHQIQ
jgi:hypothetical protein